MFREAYDWFHIKCCNLKNTQCNTETTNNTILTSLSSHSGEQTFLPGIPVKMEAQSFYWYEVM